MKIDKKGVELSMSTVVILAILLIVLIIIVLIFTGGMEDFVTKLKGIRAEIWATKPDLTAAGK